MISRVQFRLYAELSIYAPGPGHSITLTFDGSITVGEALGAIHVPVDIVELVVIGGESVGLERALYDGENVSLYPMFERFDVTSELKLRESPQRQSRFAVEVHLAKLAKYLRMVGLDTVICKSTTEILRVGRDDGRVILTEKKLSTRLLNADRALLIDFSHPREQLINVLSRLDLFSQLKPFSRCLICNGLIEPGPQEPGGGVVQFKKVQAPEHFYRCSNCRKIYWMGSHYRRMKKFVDELASPPEPS